MMNGYYAATDQVRLSEGDRKAAVRRLRSHHRRGRIDGIELEESTDAVGFARNHGDLRTVFADLEPYAAAPFRGRGPALRRGWFPFFPVLPLLVVVAVVVAVSGHVPWIPLAIAAFLLLVVAPWRRRRWGAGYAC
jgi:hypothetical protein